MPLRNALIFLVHLFYIPTVGGIMNTDTLYILPSTPLWKRLGRQNDFRNGYLWSALVALAIVLLLAGATETLLAQTKVYSIKGQTTESGTNKPVRGATLKLSPQSGNGKSFGAYADGNGNFAITANAPAGNYVLSARYLGFKEAKQVLALGDNTDITANLKLVEDVVRSEEIVVTGQAGLTSRKQLGNAIGSVTAKDIQNAGTTTLDQALSGKFSGALIQQNSGNPSGGVTIRLRGTNTVSGNADPLYIIDGIIINNDSPALVNFGGYQQNRLADLNLNDVERIEVLKGAAAAAIYGSRANNGVVQIFTKSGALGAPRVTYNARLQTDDLLRKLPMNLVPLVPAGTGAAAFSRMIAGQQTTDQLSLPASDPLSIYNGPIRRVDLQDQIFRRAWGTEHYIGVDGGTQGTRYSFSANYFGNQGILLGTSYQRTNLRARVEQVLGDWITMSANAQYSYSNSQELPNEPLGNALGGDGYGIMSSLLFAQNFIPAGKDANGAYPTDTRAFQRGSPLELIDRYDFNQKTNRFIGGLGVKLTPVEGLSIDFISGLDTYSQQATGYIPPGTLAFEYATGLSRAATANVFQMNNDLTATYTTSLTETLKSTTQIGGTLQYERRSINAAQSRALAPIARVVTAGASQLTVGDSRSEIAIYGAFLQQTFNLDNKLVATLAGRVDASSVFGVNNRWQFFPKASLSYLISEEDFWKNGIGSAVNSFKVRGAYGESGGLTSIGAYQRFTAYASSPYGGLPGLQIGGQLGTPDIKPERQREYEVGIDANFADDRVGLEVTYYDKLTRDVLFPRNLAPSTGFSNQIDNIGSLWNRGVEILLRITPVQTESFTWNTTLIANNNRNTIDGIIGGAIIGGQYSQINGFSFPVIYERFYARRPDGTLILTASGLPQTDRGTLNPPGQDQYATGANGVSQRDANGNLRTLPNGSLADPELRKILGDPNPRWTGSWINEFRFGAFTVRAQIDGMFGFQLLNYTRRTSTAFGSHADFGRELRGELPAGWAGAVIPIFQEFVENGDFVRLREVSITYDVSEMASSLGLKSARLTLSGRNLALITNYRGYDPEINSAGQVNNVRGADFATVPMPRSFSLGLNLGF
jgi:TonB-linked SusC/RagA family outer membrane protein